VSGMALAAGLTIADARRRLAQAFHDSGIDTAALDARLLVGHAVGVDHARLTARAGDRLTPAQTERIAALAARRLRHEPVARIIGSAEFWSLPLALNGATLVPRPDTETVVEAALDMLRQRGRADHALRIADLGTGSGAILLALLSELKAAWGVATDLSLSALTCARDNAIALGLSERTSFVACSYAAALKGPFDLMVSNPPYIATTEIAALDPDVRDFDPALALDGGADGLDAYRAIADDASRVMTSGGLLIVELGVGQAAPVRSLFESQGLAHLDTRADLGGIPRALISALSS